ncbi:MerR family transcriptional regulator [Rhizobium sp. L1K21]|uniref:MerR family transcriptional regulator n=1 Tax=Rhizobium sp. L1K21 TaxID=2954933 RepID=UPI002093CC0B|nr:MerR family transcriptional regulator [Rhizobium sp. L1K21]MCO6185720.1 MerR family transcriptional regulator [Rhizobium sp. L1K21]
MSEEAHASQQAENGVYEADADSGFLPAIELPKQLPSGAIGIADMADAFGVTHRTLHFYEEKGLLKAGRIGLMRVYDREQAQRMAIINACRETGMPIIIIQELMKDLAKASSRREADSIFQHFLEIRRRELQAEQSTILRQIGQLGSLIGQLNGDEDETNDNRQNEVLTKLELQCISLIAEGYSSTRLTHAMEKTPAEIAALEAGIISKLGTNNRFQAVAKAIMLGIVET